MGYLFALGGSYADVFSVRITDNNDPWGLTFAYGTDLLALKVLRSSDWHEQVTALLLSLNHANVVKYSCQSVPAACYIRYDKPGSLWSTTQAELFTVFAATVMWMRRRLCGTCDK
ncbi:hypothetical protein BV898_17195 [Hypsibius exemplaris]|uniref:Uncharacterized protein n=1 Tax=Hypsibius exemplaris TaxID=2072580 RepID=A0A9X6NEL2_HYPEX|nr:hypothetical protein BV898_17195 [Hypsibius exemplaris]